MQALLIDHDDSFTQNLKHWLLQLFEKVVVINHQEIQSSQAQPGQFDLVVMSPGPKHPQDYLKSLEFLKSLPHTQAVLGICLGMQMMAAAKKQLVVTYKPPLHGKTSKLAIQDLKLNSFSNLKVARYHSLKIDLQVDSEFEILAHSEDDRCPMWIKHKINKWMGFQFHPESFLTEKPDLYLNYLKEWLVL